MRCPWSAARCAAALIALSVAGARTGAAQVIRVELRDSAGGAPVVGALVAALDTLGIVRVERLSDASGVTLLRMPSAGTWSVRLRRIGLRPQQVTGVIVRDAQTTPVLVRMASAPPTLRAVRVTGGAICGRAPAGADRAAALWETLTFALRASVVTREDSTGSTLMLRTTSRERELGADGAVLSERVTGVTLDRGRSLNAANPDTLAEYGYVRRDPDDGSVVFFAPDESVLLSHSFITTHCFEVPARDSSPDLAELRFKPIRGRSTPDIEGTVHIDAESGELRTIRFRFVGGPGFFPAPAARAGGFVGMQRLADGRWIVSSWALRMPRFTTVEGTSLIRVAGYREVSSDVSIERP